MATDLEENEDESRTVTIALDDASPRADDAGEDGERTEDGAAGDQRDKLDHAWFLTIGPPPCASDLLAPWRHSPAKLANLPPRAVHLLEQRLNPAGCGSMRNWEFLAANLGMDWDQLVQMRRTKNPTGALLRRFGDEPVATLLELVAEAGRMDVLLSLRGYSRQMTTKAPTLAKSGPNPISHHDQLDLAMMTSTSSTSLARSSILPPGPFILLLHHEHRDSRDLRKMHRLMAKNLDRYAEPEGVKIVDVDKCMAEEDLVGSVGRHFERAQQVVMALSADYAELISAGSNDQCDQDGLDQRERMKLYLHQMTFNEVIQNGNQNRRFRVVLMPGSRVEHIPRGWPANTLHYRFPQDFERLCQRLFEGEAQK